MSDRHVRLLRQVAKTSRARLVRHQSTTDGSLDTRRGELAGRARRTEDRLRAAESRRDDAVRRRMTVEQEPRR